MIDIISFVTKARTENSDDKWRKEDSEEIQL